MAAGMAAGMEAVRRRVGFLGYEGMEALDLVGPAEVFAKVQVGGAPAYEVLVFGVGDREVRTETGLTLGPRVPLAEAARGLDTLVVPGGRGLRAPGTLAAASAWLAAQAGRVRRIASVCTGVYGLAEAGLLDGRRATTHWQFARDVAARFPRVRLEPDALYVQDGPFYTSAGITAGIDLALALVEEDHGPRCALAVARELVVYLKRPGGQAQYSEPLRFQEQGAGRFADLTTWMVVGLAGDLSVEALARRACLSPRQFARAFREHFGETPAAYVERLRLEEARRRLEEGEAAVEQVALAVGFRSADVFRRAFERSFGVSPSTYRHTFGAPARPSARRPAPAGRKR
jgi:transcriptional regulator GlxA family with amidase domain